MSRVASSKTLKLAFGAGSRSSRWRESNGVGGLETGRMIVWCPLLACLVNEGQRCVDGPDIQVLDSQTLFSRWPVHDLKQLRDNLDSLRTGLGRRGTDVPWDVIQKLSEERRTLTTQVEQFRHELKKGSEEVAALRRSNQPAETAMTAMKQLGDRIKEIEGGLRGVENALTDLALRIPNLPHGTVPAGADSSANLEIRRWGTLPAFSTPPKPHWELGEALGVLDFDRASKIA